MPNPTFERNFDTSLKAGNKSPPAIRDFELRLSEHKTARTLQINVKFTPSDYETDRPKVKARLMADFEKLVDNLLK